ncbi:MAG: ABC-F family ATP-binding cassette domain-containing protein [Gemmatimonadota bacterium]|nr:MAG: ABC-F family ATP-binding cassette domain-containing protein [Gemmatimonadota bacterium]
MSSQVLLSHLSFSYTSAVDVLTEVSLCLSQGWFGVVGPNGSGKTTLLRVLAGDLPGDPAMIQRTPSDMIVRYCPQRVEHLTPAIRDFAESWQGNAHRLMGQLELEPTQLAHWQSLSPGERKRWQIGAALVDVPELLLLDEPTNHLDTRAKKLLFDRLERYQGIGVLVSHDRQLLDSLTCSTIRIHPGGTVKLYSGNYSAARELWLNEEKRSRQTRSKLQAERRKLKRRLDAARRSREKAESDMDTAKRLKSVHDSDARSMAAKGRAASAEKRLGREVTVLRRKLGKADETVEQARVDKQVGRSVFVLEEVAPMQNLIWLKTPAIRKGDRILLRDVDVLVRRESRIHLKGPNGSGKTTLIEELLQASQLPEERILYLPQELPHERVERNRRMMESFSDMAKGRLLQVVAALGVPPERLLASEQPSPGEARKLALAMGLSRQAWLLLLDEPTNHLDLPSIERIEEALVRYSSALILVSHDDRFARTLTRETWRLEEGRLVM